MMGAQDSQLIAGRMASATLGLALMLWTLADAFVLSCSHFSKHHGSIFEMICAAGNVPVATASSSPVRIEPLFNPARSESMALSVHDQVHEI